MSQNHFVTRSNIYALLNINVVKKKLLYVFASKMKICTSYFIADCLE